MSIENEEDIKKEETVEEPQNKVSRARNRTVMLTPEMTGQVRNAIKEEIKVEEPSDFFRPGQKKVETKLPEQSPTITDKEPLQQSNLGLKFGKSVNRSRTTKLSREEVDKAVRAESIQEVSQPEKFTLPTPVVPKAFDPLTSVSPPNHGPGRVSDLGRPAPKVEKPKQQQPVAPAMIEAAPISRVQALTGTTKIIGFLVCFDVDPNGEVYEIRAGRKLITSRPTDHGEYMLIQDDSVSPLHAILRTTKEGNLQVLDQLFEHGTGITRQGESEEIEVAGGLETVRNGDILRFGKRSFLVCLLPSK